MINIFRFLQMKREKSSLVIDSNGNITSEDAIKEREIKAKSFWSKLNDTENILGRELTGEEIMSAMQRKIWPCACCGDYLEPIDKTHAHCPTCGLKFRLKDNKIQTMGNMSEDYE